MTCPNHPEVAADLVACARCGKEYCRDCVIELEGRPYDAVCKEEQLRDLRSGSAGPTIASAGRRLGANILDWLVMFPAMALLLAMGVMTRASPQGGMGLGIAGFLVPSLVFTVYEALMLQSSGQTLGKKLLGVQVVGLDGAALTSRQCWWRAGSRALMAVTYVLGLVDSLAIFSARGRTLHDRAADSLVIRLNR